MKRICSGVFTVLVLLSCGSNDTNKTEDHSKHKTDTTTTASPTMMSIMHKMDSDMQKASLTNDPDRDFAQMMKLHHQSAVEMAALELTQGTDTAVQRMAAKMKADQQREIAAFDRFLQANASTTPSDRFAAEFKGTMKAMDHSGYTPGNTIDAEFINMMIPHHQSGIDMAKVYLKYGTKNELKEIARNIISSQAEEIILMQALHGGGKHH
jgi:uncharacterized protein (DUF305 family)